MSRSVSPGGALLRASRVFSIPPALPRPAPEHSSIALFNSESATLPHPTHLSITTPHSSLQRGDWGFKRPLPLRATTKTSTPIIRVDSIDTYEHITEFSSSADYSLNLKKWQEMGVPLSAPVVNHAAGAFRSDNRKSVFDDDIDYTTEGEKLPGSDDSRWKFKGPWLAGQSEGEFADYVASEVRNRKTEFQQYLRTACANALTAEARRNAGDQVPQAIQAEDVTNEQIAQYVKILRNDRKELYKMIRAFLDLPPAPTKQMQEQMESFLDQVYSSNGHKPMSPSDFSVSSSPYAETGPPKTHPSAGLAYSRSSAKMFNHPVHGPQKHPPPVQARVVLPRGASGGRAAPALGVGGFVTEAPAGSWDSFKVNQIKSKEASIPGLMGIEPEKVGGSKTYVQPTHARIDPKGRVLLNVVSADDEAVAVLEGRTDEIPRHDFKLSAALDTSRSSLLGKLKSSGQRHGYGLSFDRKP